MVQFALIQGALILGALAASPDALADAPAGPQVLQAPDAVWPDDLRARGIGGEVSVVLEVDGAGRVRGVRVLRSPHVRLSREAVRAAAAMRFEPTGRATTLLRTVAFAEQDADVIVVEARSPWREGVAQRRDVSSPPGAYSIGRTDLQDQPGAGGDIARAIAVLPGVSATSLRNPSLAIRGGAPDETLWVVDDMALPSRRSAGGVLARINPALVDEVHVHAGTQPATVAESAAGVVRVQLLDPDDTEVDGHIEVSPLLAQAWVSTPIGQKGAGNSVMVAARRSLLEPWTAALALFDVEPGLRVAVGDVAVRARAKAAEGHELWLFASHGEERVDVTALAGTARDQSATDLVQLRYRWQVSRRSALRQDLGLIHETQDTWLAEQDHRSDRRTRWSWRGDLQHDLAPGHTLNVGADVSRFDLKGQGTTPDPRARPPFDRVPWYDLDPPSIALDPMPGWTEAASWAQWHMSPAAGLPLDARVGLRMTWLGPWSQVALSPRASLGWELDTGTILRTWGAITHQLPRDPVHLDVNLGPDPLLPARAYQVGLGAEQPLGHGLGLRLDVWRREQHGIVVWTDDVALLRQGARSASVGQGFAQGAEVSVAVRRGPVRALLSWSGVHSARTNPLATVGPASAEPWWVVPHMVRLTGDTQLGPRGAWKLGTHLEARSGARQATVQVVGDADEFAVVVAPNGGERLPTRVRWSVRGQRRLVLRRVQVTAYVDLMHIVGGRAPVGIALRPVDGEAPEVAYTRDFPFLPWAGLRAEF